MFRSLIGTTLLCLSLSTFAAIDTNAISKDFNSLTETQKAEIVQEIQRKTAVNDGNVLATPDRVERWVDVGTKIGQAMGGAAREIGIAANDFAVTPLGKFTMFLIAYKVVGQDLVHLAVHVGGGFLFFVTWLPLWIYIFRRMCLIKSITYTPIEGRKIRQKKIEYYDPTNGSVQTHRLVMMFVFAVLAATTILVVVN